MRSAEWPFNWKLEQVTMRSPKDHPGDVNRTIVSTRYRIQRSLTLDALCAAKTMASSQFWCDRLNERMQMMICIAVRCVALEPIRSVCYWCCRFGSAERMIIIGPDKPNGFKWKECAAASSDRSSCRLFRDSHERIIDKLCHDFGSTPWQREPIPMHVRPQLLFTPRQMRVRDREKERSSLHLFSFH